MPVAMGTRMHALTSLRPVSGEGGLGAVGSKRRLQVQGRPGRDARLLPSCGRVPTAWRRSQSMASVMRAMVDEPAAFGWMAARSPERPTPCPRLQARERNKGEFSQGACAPAVLPEEGKGADRKWRRATMLEAMRASRSPSPTLSAMGRPRGGKADGRGGDTEARLGGACCLCLLC